MNLKKKAQLLKGTAEIAVLSMLDRRDMYGYQVMQKLSESGNGSVSVTEGNLYSILYRMEAEGILTGRWQTVTGKRRRRVYSITRFGKKELGERRIFWKQLALTVNRILHATA